MSQAQAAAAVDRLPWLEDEPKPVTSRPSRDRGSHREIAGWAVIAILLVAGISYWLGVHSWQAASSTKVKETGTIASASQPQTSTQPPAQKQPQVALEPQPEVAPAPIREVPMARPRVARRFSARHFAAQPRHERRSPVLRKTVTTQKAVPQAANPQSRGLTVWPASQSEGARGRIVRIGAFGSRQQAKLGWRYMVRAYPAVAHLPATVVEARNSRGRPFYRFQIGTTSQAHSEVLCQRMGRIRFSCAVVGLSWKPKGVER
jgi:hypothetical protein